MFLYPPRVCPVIPTSRERRWTWEVAWRTESLSRVELCPWASETGWAACLQMLCKRLQRYNRHTCGGAAKGSRGGWYRRRCVLRHPHWTPWVPSRIGQRCVGRNVVPKPYSLGYWQNGSWAWVMKQGIEFALLVEVPRGIAEERDSADRTVTPTRNKTKMKGFVEISTLLVRSKNRISGRTCRPFIPVCTGSGSGMQNPLANFHWRFLFSQRWSGLPSKSPYVITT